MNTFRMKNTDLSVTAIGLGSTATGSDVDGETSFAILDRWIEAGGNLIDTAHVYGLDRVSDVSRSEETIGSWMKDRGVRDRIVLCTKGGHPDVDPKRGFGKPRLHKDELENDLSKSLRSLKTDHIDIYLLHRDDPAIPVSEIIDWLEAQKKEGKIRYYGCSNWTLPRILEAEAYAKETGATGFVTNQIAGGLAKQDEAMTKYTDMLCLTPEFLDYHRKSGMSVMSYMSMNNGYFQKRIRGAEISPFSARMYGNETNEKLLLKLREMDEHGINLTSVMVQYIMAYGIPVTALFGFSRKDQLEELLEAVRLPVPAEDLRELYRIRWEEAAE